MPRRSTLPRTLVLVVTLILVGRPVSAAPGDPDPAFSANGTAVVFTQGSVGTAVVLDPRGRTTVAGYSVDDEVDVVVARFLPDGTLDPAFGGGDGRVRLDLGGADHVFDAALVPGAGIVLAGVRTTADADVAFVLRLGDRGRPLASFADDGLRTISFAKRYQVANAIAVTDTGRFVVGGWVSNGGTSRSAFARLLPDGSLDAAFSRDGRATVNLSEGAEQIRDLTVLDNGRILGAGSAEGGANDLFALVRLLPNGRLDPRFGAEEGFTLTNVGRGADSAAAIAVRSDGRIVLAGSSGGGWGVVRFLRGGGHDASFGASGEVTLGLGRGPEAAYDVVPVGVRLLVVGTLRGTGSPDLAVVRLKDSGEPDGSFAGDGVALLEVAGGPDTARAAALADGRRLVVGGDTWAHGRPRLLAARILTR
ncbi:MAG TPA: hypothetical protein VIB62_07260 [Actinomycetota bacterium]|jgi:uncharacterized delta-60 repeat protein